MDNPDPINSSQKMNQSNPADRRQFPRVRWNFVMRFRIKEYENINWEISSVEDVSEGGCLFFSPLPFQKGQMLDIQIHLPRLQGFMFFNGEVVRVNSQKTGQFEKYAVAVKFTFIEEEHRKKFLETIDFFLKKQK